MKKTGKTTTILAIVLSICFIVGLYYTIQTSKPDKVVTAEKSSEPMLMYTSPLSSIKELEESDHYSMIWITEIMARVRKNLLLVTAKDTPENYVQRATEDIGRQGYDIVRKQYVVIRSGLGKGENKDIIILVVNPLSDQRPGTINGILFEVKPRQ